VDVSRDFISRVTDSVLEDVRAWQNRPLDACYPIVWIDALVIKVRVDGVVRNRPVYNVLGLDLEGKKQALGLWIGTGDESAKFWLKILNDLRNRGVGSICIVCCDGLTGLPDAVEATFGDAWVQCCVVHLIRNSLKHVSYKDRKQVARDLKPVYAAATEEAASEALEAFDQRWGASYPMIAASWRSNWERFIPYLAFPENIRRIIYTTNSVEAVHRQIRKVIKNRGHFPTEDAALKLLWLVLRNAEKKWTYPIKDWPRALHQFAIYFPNRIPEITT
jgi:putative transposase